MYHSPESLLAASGISVLCILWIGLLFFGSGKIIGLKNSIPPEFYGSMLCGALACFAVSSLHLYLSLIIRSFAVPAGIAFAGGLAGLMTLSQGIGYALPYSMLQMGLRSTELTNDIDLPVFTAVSCIYIAVFFLLSVFHIKRADPAER